MTQKMAAGARRLWDVSLQPTGPAQDASKS